MLSFFPQLSLIYDRRKTSSIDKPASIELRVTYNYKQKYIATGVSVLPKQWKNGKVINHPDAGNLNQILDKIVIDTRQLILENFSKGNTDINDFLCKDSKHKISFLDFCKERSLVRQYGKSKDTKQRYNRFIKYFTLYGKIQNYRDITEKNIIEYDTYLTNQGMKPYSKWNNYHRFLNSFIMDAIDEGYLSRNPYKFVNINRESTSNSLEKCLTIKEFSKLIDTPMPTECLSKVKDLFIFQTYTCLRYSDMARFDIKNIEDINGLKVYRCIQKKTGKSATIPLLKPVLDILHKYNNTLPVISNVKYNLYLKEVSKKAKLNKPLTTHWARHTGATMLLNEGVDMKIVTKICGHSSTRITEKIYAKLLDETVVDAIKEFSEKIKTPDLHRQGEKFAHEKTNSIY